MDLAKKKQENLCRGGCILSKYGAEKITVDGIRFDSKIEAKYYEHLKDLKAKELIINFELQPQYIIQPKFTNSFGKKIQAIILKADFLIYEIDNTLTVIDIKGMATPEAKLKRKMFWKVYPGEELKWLVWSKGQWLNFDDVAKERAKRKRVAKKIESAS